MSLDIKFYLSRFTRRLHYFLIVFLAVAAVGVTLAYTLPPVYRAEARLLMEAPQIPDELAPSTVRTAAPEILQIIEQRLMTRANLLGMAERLGIYEGQPPMAPADIVLDMRERARLVLPNALDLAASVLVSFDAPTAEMSARVTNEFVDAIVKDSIELRTSSSAETLDFFQAEVLRLNEALAKQGAQILEFKLANKDALPDSLDYRRTRQASQQERLLQMQRDLAGLNDRRVRLVELYERTGQVEAVTDGRTPAERQLEQLKQDLAAALAIYSPQNPQVRILQARVATLERTVASQVATANPTTPDMSVFELQQADIDGQISFVNEQKVLVEAELKELQASIDATPGNAITLDVLQRDYDNIQTQYNLAADRLSQAATGDRIEVLSKGQRITVLEQAVVPSEPASPDRKLIAAAGIAAGMVLGLALVVVQELLDRSIRRPTELVTALGIAPFASIPYFRTRRDIWRRRSIIGAGFLIAGIGIPLMIFLLHTYYQPIDVLVAQVLDKVGLDSLAGKMGVGASK